MRDEERDEGRDEERHEVRDEEKDEGRDEERDEIKLCLISILPFFAKPHENSQGDKNLILRSKKNEGNHFKARESGFYFCAKSCVSK